MPKLEDTAEIRSTGIFGNAYDDHDLETLNTPYANQSVGAEADFNNMEPSTIVSPIPITRVHSIHPKAHIIRDPKLRYMFANPPRFCGSRISRKKFYKVVKALYGLHQTLELRLKGDILPVQVYVDGIIFGLTKKSLCDEFEQIMHNRFQMSSMGELTFFLGLQVKQKEDGIFISQDKYVGEILKKFSFSSIRTASTPMETNKALTKDEYGEDVDIHLYKSMIRSLMYLTSSRPDIMFSVCACSIFQWNMHVPAWTGNPQQEVVNFLVKGVGDEAVHKELGDRMERAATTASSFEADAPETSPSRIMSSPSFSPQHTPDEGTSWIQEDIEMQEKISDDNEVVLEEEEPTELVEDQVSTVAANLVYIRKSTQKMKDKEKAIMQESEPLNKLKKRVQVQMSMDEELAKKVFKEEQAKAMAEQEQERINFEAALELQK
ncbi:putative ribonuclease H-like domain-containing protein [Tanacetum coccineum]